MTWLCVTLGSMISAYQRTLFNWHVSLCLCLSITAPTLLVKAASILCQCWKLKFPPKLGDRTTNELKTERHIKTNHIKIQSLYIMYSSYIERPHVRSHISDILPINCHMSPYTRIILYKYWCINSAFIFIPSSQLV